VGFFFVTCQQLARLQTTGKNMDALFKVISECIENVCDEDLQGAARVPSSYRHTFSVLERTLLNLSVDVCAEFWRDACSDAAPACGP